MFLNAFLLGIGLSMDAFSVSIIDGLSYPSLTNPKRFKIATIFALFQFLMPLIGWYCVHYLFEAFNNLQFLFPWISLILLGYIGGKMLYEGFKKDKEEEEIITSSLTIKELILQGIATSIDALSVGFTIASYNFLDATLSSLIVGLETLVLCLLGLRFGQMFVDKFALKANIFGGIILIVIGIQIFIKGI